VIMPLDIGWQGRAVLDGQQPKYLSKTPSDMVWRSEPITKRVCLVEDILSAARVGAVYPSVAILGTEPRSVMQWIAKCDEVVLWFDNDAAGHKARAKVETVLRWIPSVRLCDVRTSKDPKCYTTEDIIGLLRNRGRVQGI
jgi:DNA primase